MDLPKERVVLRVRAVPIVVLLALACVACATREVAPVPTRAIVLGLLEFDANGAPQLVECDSQRRIRFTGMAPGQVLYLRRRASELERRGRRPVTVEVSGYVQSTAEGTAMAHAGIIGIAPGQCTSETAHVGSNQDY